MADALKAGTKVRVLHTDWPKFIPVGTVTHVIQGDVFGDAYLWCEALPETGLYFCSYEFEVIEDEPAHQSFKVGDRVRTKGYEGTHWDGEGVVTEEYDGFCILAVINGREGGFAPHELAPATLKLEAGKYYRTRDGRKVGPMRHTDEYWFGDVVDGPHGKAFLPDGNHGNEFISNQPEFDLIAEWVDEPQENEPVTAATQPKFKVGDVVKFRDDYPGYARGQKATVIGINIWGDDGIQVEMDDGDISTEDQSDLEAWMAEQDASRDNTPTPTTGFTVPLCAYEDTVTTTALGDAYVAGYKAGLAAQQAQAA